VENIDSDKKLMIKRRGAEAQRFLKFIYPLLLRFSQTVRKRCVCLQDSKTLR